MPSFLKKQSKAAAEIHLLPDVDRGQPTVWLSNEDICGRAVFKLPPNVTFSHARVQIKGKKTQLNIQDIVYAEVI